jgi:DNA-binding response OmpR family regulator
MDSLVNLGNGPRIAPFPGAVAKDPDDHSAHILVVDDDPTTRVFVRALLEHHAYQVSEARDGAAALDLLASGAYSLMILDLNMPRVGGRDVLSSVRKQGPMSMMPVVVLTATDGSNEVELLNQGADDFVSKPIVPDRLIARIRANLRRAGSSRGR